MHLSSLKIRHFRNLASVDLQLSPGVNLFCGANAQGKTALLEAVAYLATSTSHRTNRDDELIQWGQEAAYARGILNEDEQQSLEFGLSREGKQVKMAGVVLKRIKDLYGHLRIVLFVPEDLKIVSGSPSERRRFLDLMISQVHPDHITRLQKFQQVLRSRNQLLRKCQEKKYDPVEFEIWDDQLIEAALPVIETRRSVLGKFATALKENAEKLTSGKESLGIWYHCTIPEPEDLSLRQSYAEQLMAQRSREIERGSTAIGPHRDDLVFRVNERDLRSFGSQGQRRTAVLALRLAELAWLKETTEQLPLMLIDDVIYEMDEGRRNHFFEEIDKGGQSLVTATEPEHLAPLLPKAALFKVEAGKVGRG